MIQQQGGKISRDRSVIRLFAHVCKKTSSPEEAKYDSTWMNTFNIENQEAEICCPFNSFDRDWTIQRVHSIHSTKIGQTGLKEEIWINGGKGFTK